MGFTTFWIVEQFKLRIILEPKERDVEKLEKLTAVWREILALIKCFFMKINVPN